MVLMVNTGADRRRPRRGRAIRRDCLSRSSSSIGLARPRKRRLLSNALVAEAGGCRGYVPCRLRQRLEEFAGLSVFDAAQFPMRVRRRIRVVVGRDARLALDRQPARREIALGIAQLRILQIAGGMRLADRGEAGLQPCRDVPGTGGRIGPGDRLVDQSGDFGVALIRDQRQSAGERRPMIVVAERTGSVALPPLMGRIAVIVPAVRAGGVERAIAPRL